MRWRRGLAGLMIALSLRGQATDRAAQIRSARELADRGSAQGLEQALTQYARLLTEARADSDRQSEAEVVYLSGVAELRLGRFPEAVTFYQRSVALYRELGNQPRLATALNDLGLALSRRSDQSGRSPR
jgi:tetratricopeptide (TPR) repeat protein